MKEQFADDHLRRMDKKHFTIPYEKKSIEACSAFLGSACRPSTGIVLTHGAGGDMNLRQLVLLSQYLMEKGFLVVRFTCKGLNLSYRVKVYTQVLRFVKEQFPDLNHCFIGGRSMGARAAVGVYNNVKGTPLDDFIRGIICISYPLHTKDSTESLRDGPLFNVDIPICFISGTNDEMCHKELLAEVLPSVPKSQVKWLDDADHGLKVKGTLEKDVVEQIGDFIVSWCEKCKTTVETEDCKLQSHLIKEKIDKKATPEGKKGTKRKRGRNT